MMALIQAIHAQNTFMESNLLGRFTGAFTMFLTKVTVETFQLALSHPPQGKTANNTEKGAQGTDEPAIKAGPQQI
jgi:hypothetical protein